MSAPFRLDWAWTRREDRHGAEAGHAVDASPLETALDRFVARHVGHVDLHAGRIALPLDLRADISLVFEQLPDVLGRLAVGDEAELYFPEPGSDLTLRMRRRGEHVDIAVRRGDLAGSQFADLPEELPPVEARDFIAEWRRCLGALLEAILECDPSLASDPSYRSYRERLQDVTES